MAIPCDNPMDDEEGSGAGRVRVIAVGGGGFTHDLDAALEDFILAETGRWRPRVGYVGTASRDDPVKLARFYQRFETVAAAASHLPPDADGQAAARWLADLDLVYVGGGNTEHLVETWRSTGLGATLVSAARRGVLMAGVSAGAVCWFDAALSDSGGRGLAPLRGLGLLRGSACPHYSTEPARPPAFRDRIAAGELPDGIAIDDGVAVLLDDSGPCRVFSARPDAWAWRIGRDGDTTRTEPLPAGSA